MTPFPLRRVLDLRVSREQKVTAELVRANDAASAASAAHDAALDDRHTSEVQLARLTSAGSTVGELRALSSVLESFDARLDATSEALDATRDAVEQAHATVTSATRDRQMLERLRDHHVAAARQEEAARERLEMDAVALERFTRRQPRDATGEGGQ